MSREPSAPEPKGALVPAAPQTPMQAAPSRRLSATERLWVVSDRILPPFVNQMVLEGPPEATAELDLELWQRALDRTIAVHPGSRVKLAGSLGATRWVADGPPPPLRVVDGSHWDSFGPEGAPFLHDRLDPVAGPTTEVMVVRGTPARVIIRTHHAAMDGGGTLAFASDLFACLRGEEPRGASAGPPIDEEIAAELGNRTKRPLSRICPAPTGATDSNFLTTTWRRLFIPGRYRQLLPKVAFALTELVDEADRSRMRFDVPVDLRRHRPDLISSANLTGFVRVTMDTCLEADDPIAAFDEQLKSQIAEGRHGAVLLNARFVHRLPLGFMGWVGNGAARGNLRKNKHDVSGTLSNLGRLDLAPFTGGGFAPERVFFIPPPSPSLPLFMALTGTDAGVDLCATMPRCLASGGRLSAMLDHVAERLMGEEAGAGAESEARTNRIVRAASTPERSPIFVVGTGRSGTTLLRMILCAHPRIHLTHEASFYVWEGVFPWRKKTPEEYLHYFLRTFSYRWLKLDPRPILRALPRPISREQIPLLYTAVMRAKAAQYGKVRFGDKTPSHSGSLKRIFRDYPDAKVVRIVRDPRGVIKSLSRMPWGSRSIIAATMLCEIERKQVRGFHDRILEIRLEDLLADTRTVMTKVLDYVEEPWSDHVLDHTAHLPEPDDLPPVPWFQTSRNKPGKQLARWDEYGPREIRLIEFLNRKGLAAMDYERVAMDKPPGRLSVFLRYLSDAPELWRFMYHFARLAGGSRDPEYPDTRKSRARFAKLNPRSWALYPGFELPSMPDLPEGWDSVRAEMEG